jgi:hypothetical protein
MKKARKTFLALSIVLISSVSQTSQHGYSLHAFTKLFRDLPTVFKNLNKTQLVGTTGILAGIAYLTGKSAEKGWSAYQHASMLPPQAIHCLMTESDAHWLAAGRNALLFAGFGITAGIGIYEIIRRAYTTLSANSSTPNHNNGTPSERT